jgi:hypothetical protein
MICYPMSSGMMSATSQQMSSGMMSAVPQQMSSGMMSAAPQQMLLDHEASDGLQVVEEELQRLMLLKQKLAASKAVAAMSNNGLALAACDAAASMHHTTLEQALAIKAVLEGSNQLLPAVASSAMQAQSCPLSNVVFGGGSSTATADLMGCAGLGAVGDGGPTSGQLGLQVAAQMKLEELMAVQEKQMMLQQELMTLLPRMNLPN